MSGCRLLKTHSEACSFEYHTGSVRAVGPVRAAGEPNAQLAKGVDRYAIVAGVPPVRLPRLSGMPIPAVVRHDILMMAGVSGRRSLP